MKKLVVGSAMVTIMIIAVIVWMGTTVKVTASEDESVEITTEEKVVPSPVPRVPEERDEYGKLPLETRLYNFYVSNGIKDYRPMVAETHIDENLINEQVDWINNVRAEKGLPALTLDEDLCVVAQYRAIECWDGEFSHYHGPNNAVAVKNAYAAYHDCARYKGVILGENLLTCDIGNDLYIYDTDELLSAFLDSPSHYSLLTSTDYCNIGIGIYNADGEIYIAHVFSN